MFEGLNKKLVEAIRATQARRDRALADVQRIYSSEMYSNEYRDQECHRIIKDTGESVANLKFDGVNAIAAKVDELNATEHREAELRAIDTDYLKRLEMKLNTVDRLISKEASSDGNIDESIPNELSDTTLQAYFSEFADDPIAIAAIYKKLGSRAIRVVPTDNTGKRQSHLQKQVQRVFELLMNRAIQFPERGFSEMQNVPAFQKAEEDAFVEYCMKQDADFSLDDNEVSGQIAANNPELKTAIESILWRFQMN